MRKIILLIFLIILAPKVYADNYISPESYAVNEADFLDYRMIPAPKSLNIDNLDDNRFQAPNLVEKDFNIADEDKIEKKVNNTDEAYKKRMSYKLAKWWIDQRYKREEAHHGTLHEIKVNKRIEYENREQEKLEQKKSGQEKSGQE